MFALRDRWAVAVFVAAAVVVAVASRAQTLRSHRPVDAGLFLCLAFAGFQLIPLPPVLRMALSPAAATVDRALLLVPPSDPMRGPWRPLTVDAVSSAWALALAVGVALTFWSARSTFERRGGLRLTARGVAWFGLILAVVSFVQREVSPRLFYGIWPVHARTNVPAPLGPFLNRNDLACWLILAVPLTAGYIMARVRSHMTTPGAHVDDIVDSRMAILFASVCLMSALLLASTSRSGIVGCAAGLMALLTLGRRRVSAAQFAGLVAALAVVGVIAGAYVSLPALTSRFNSTFAPDMGRGRMAIWRQTWPMARDFLRTGLGVGAFERGMTVYEPRPFTLFINQAHDEYLQILVEGGIPLLLLALFTVAAGWREAARRLRDDATSVGWLRAGAVGGMIAVAVQSVWDTGLRMPANAVLFGVLAAVALYDGGAGAAIEARDPRP